MLSKNANKIFKFVKQSSDQKISYADLKKEFNFGYDQMHSACDLLIQKDLVKEKQGIPLPGHSQPSPWGIVLTEKGRNRWKYTVEDIWLFTLKSVIVPIIVSIITTLATLLITYFLSS